MVEKIVYKNRPNYITASVDTSELKMLIKGDELINESSSYKVGHIFKVTEEAASYIGGGAFI